MSKCIITGATGYIGSHVLKYLLLKGWECNIIVDPTFGYANIEDVKRDVTIFEYDNNITSLIAFFQEKKVDVVFHLAAAVISDYHPQQVPVLIQSNVQFGTEVLEAMKSTSTRLLVTTGTYWQNYTGNDYNPVDLYAATKEAFDKIVKYYVEAYDFRVINLRLFDVYGEDDRRPKLWQSLCNIMGTKKMIKLSPGEQKLDLIYISDVCTAYETAYYTLLNDDSISNNTYGVCTGNLLTLKAIIKIFEEVTGKKINAVFGGKPYKKREVMNPKINYEKLPHWKARVSIYDGFSKFIK